MDSKLARWGVLVYLDQPTIKRLHDWEMRLAKQRKTWETVLSHMLSTGLSGQFQLTPYWDPHPKFSEGEKEQRMSEFNALIYPVWGPTWKRWEATWNDPKCRAEIEVLHECDLAIKASLYTPNRIYGGTLDAMREKTAKAKTYGRQYEDAINS